MKPELKKSTRAMLRKIEAELASQWLLETFDKGITNCVTNSSREKVTEVNYARGVHFKTGVHYVRPLIEVLETDYSEHWDESSLASSWPEPKAEQSLDFLTIEYRERRGIERRPEHNVPNWQREIYAMYVDLAYEENIPPNLIQDLRGGA